MVFDVTHSLQLPGGGDGVTAGQAQIHHAARVCRRRRWRRRSVPRGARRTVASEERLRRTRSVWISLEPLLRRLLAIDAIVKGRTAPVGANEAPLRG
ncbi:MAG: hypothetical protein QM736_19390 [Vicinamibacterales bacterium]